MSRFDLVRCEKKKFWRGRHAFEGAEVVIFAKSIRAFGGPCQNADEVDQPFL